MNIKPNSNVGSKDLRYFRTSSYMPKNTMYTMPQLICICNMIKPKTPERHHCLWSGDFTFNSKEILGIIFVFFLHYR